MDLNGFKKISEAWHLARVRSRVLTKRLLSLFGIVERSGVVSDYPEVT